MAQFDGMGSHQFKICPDPPKRDRIVATKSERLHHGLRRIGKS
jgi:hypothetical protein